MNKLSEKICLLIIHWGSYLILLLPLLAYDRVLYPFIFSKMIVFQILVEIILAAWLILIIYKKDFRPNWRHPLILTFLIFVGTLILTSLVGVNPYNSSWSSQERMTGLLTMLHFWIWFIILTSTLKSWPSWRKLIWTSLMGSFLVGLYGLGQKIGLKILLPEHSGQMTSTLGNPIFLGTYVVLNAFLAGFMWFREKRPLYRNVIVIVLMFNVLIVLLAASRGALFAFILMVLLFCAYLLLTIRRRQTKILFLLFFIVFLLIIVGSIIFLQTQTGKSWIIKGPYILQRITYLTSDIKARALAWQIAWQGFKERPILGWGWENYNIVFNKYYQPYYLTFGLENTWFSKSHNQIMDLLALTGIIGTLAYLIFYSAIFWLIFKKIKIIKKDEVAQNKQKILALVVLALLFCAYFIQNLTAFDNPAPLIIFYFSLSLTYFIVTENAGTPESGQDSNKQQLSAPQFRRRPLPLFIILIIILLSWSVYKFNLEPWQQSHLTEQAVTTSRINLLEGLKLYRQALAKNVFTNAEARLQLTTTLSEQNKNDPSYPEGLKLAIDEMTKNVHENPLDARYWLYLGQLDNLGVKYDKQYLGRAEEALNQALRLSPKRQQIYFALAQNKILQGDRNGAIQNAQTAVALDPKIGLSYYQLGVVEFNTENYQATIDDFKAANNLNYYYDGVEDPTFPYLCLSTAQTKLKKYDNAIATIDYAINRWPDNIQLIVQKIMIYEAASDWNAIKAFLDQVRISNPDLADQLQTQLNEQLKNNNN